MLAGLLLLVLAPIEPAEAVFGLVDPMGRPIVGVEVDGQKSDAKGIVRVKLPMPDDAQPPAYAFDHTFKFRLGGDIVAERHFGLFRGAWFKKTVVINHARGEVLVLGPDGKPRPSAWAQVWWPGGSTGGKTDKRGVYAFRHPDPGWLDIVVGYESWRFQRGAAMRVRLKREPGPLLSGISFLPAGPSLEGVLLRHSGKPAEGWFVGSAESMGASVFCGFRTEHYQTRGVVRVGKDGRFSLKATSNRLVLLSPLGLPLLHGTAPGSWSKPGPRRIRIHLPPRAGEMTGRVLDAKGRPVAGAEVEAQSNGAGWSLHLNAKLATRTDAQGRYRVPFWAGQRPSVVIRAPGCEEWHEHRRQAGDVTPKRMPSLVAQKAAVEIARHILLDIRDDRGNRIDGVSIYTWVLYQGNEQSGTRQAHADSHGLHLFLPESLKGIDAVGFSLTHPSRDSLDRKIAVGPERTQTIRVAWPDKSRRPPLRGRVVGADGEPVVGARVSLSRPYYGDTRPHPVEKWTDPDGRFFFRHAPNPCSFMIQRRLPLPGFTDWKKMVTRKKGEDVVIRLARFGSVRLELPKGSALRASSFRIGNMWFFDEDWRAARIEPGTHFLGLPLHADEFGTSGLDNIAVTVRPGRETVVKLSAEMLPRRRTLVWTELRCPPGTHVSMERREAVLFADIADETGRVRVRCVKGRAYVVVGRIPDRGLGWLGFLADGKPKDLELKPVRTLRVSVPETGGQEIRAEPQGLVPALAGQVGHVERAGPAEWVFRDLLVGMVLRVRVEGGYTADVKIEPGKGEQVLRFAPLGAR